VIAGTDDHGYTQFRKLTRDLQAETAVGTCYQSDASLHFLLLSIYRIG
jgi:hypothetical protein